MDEKMKNHDTRRLCLCGEVYEPTKEKPMHCVAVLLDEFAARELGHLIRCVIASGCGNPAHEEILRQLDG